MEGWVWIIIGLVAVAILASVIVALVFLKRVREKRNFERGIKMTPLLIHLPPTTDDIQTGSRDERDITNEAISQAQVMYSILASMTTKGLKAKIYGQDHVSFEIVAMNGLIKYYTLVPNDKVEIMKQAVISAYPTARLEISTRANIFSEEGKVNGVAGCELRLKKEYCYPINTYEDSKRDGSLAILGAMSTAKEGEGVGIQILIRPAKSSWSKGALERVQNIKEGTSKKTVFTGAGNLFADIVEAPFRPPNERSKEEIEEKRNSWVKLVKIPFEEAMDELYQKGLIAEERVDPATGKHISGGWHYSLAGMKEISDEQARAIIEKGYSQFVSLYVVFELAGYESHEVRAKAIADKKAMEIKEMDKRGRKPRAKTARKTAAEKTDGSADGNSQP